MDVSNFDVLGFFWNLLSNLLAPIANFFLSFLPDGDPAVYSVIDGISNVGGGSTFNVFYFCDWVAVGLCLGVVVTVMIVVEVVKLVRTGLDVAHKAIEAIPVVE